MAGVKGKSGGARVGAGGARPGAGRPRKHPIKEQKIKDDGIGWGGSRVGAGRPRVIPIGESKTYYKRKPDVWPLFKTCTICAIEKRRDLFNTDKSRPKKIPSMCRSCSTDYAKNYYKENTEKCKDANKRWQTSNPEKHAASKLGIPFKECPTELIELKLEQMTIKRLSRQIKQTTKAHNETSTNIS